jgi:hypothetical protein
MVPQMGTRMEAPTSSPEAPSGLQRVLFLGEGEEAAYQQGGGFYPMVVETVGVLDSDDEPSAQIYERAHGESWMEPVAVDDHEYNGSESDLFGSEDDDLSSNCYDSEYTDDDEYLTYNPVRYHVVDSSDDESECFDDDVGEDDDPIWAIRIKRYSDGSFRKTKERCCVRGDHQMEEVEYFDEEIADWHENDSNLYYAEGTRYYDDHGNSFSDCKPVDQFGNSPFLDCDSGSASDFEEETASDTYHSLRQDFRCARCPLP